MKLTSGQIRRYKNSRRHLASTRPDNLGRTDTRTVLARVEQNRSLFLVADLVQLLSQMPPGTAGKPKVPPDFQNR